MAAKCRACDATGQPDDVLCRKCGTALKQQTGHEERESASPRIQSEESQEQEETYAKLDAVEVKLRASAAESVTTRAPEPSPKLVARPPRRTFLKRPWTSDWVFWVVIGATLILIPRVYEIGQGVWDQSAGTRLLEGTTAVLAVILTATAVVGLPLMLIRGLVRRASDKKKLASNPSDVEQGWKPDPLQVRRQRWWDGERWTGAVNPEDPTFRDGAGGAVVSALAVAALAVAFLLGTNVDLRTPEMILQEIDDNPEQVSEILAGLSDESTEEVIELLAQQNMLENGSFPQDPEGSITDFLNGESPTDTGQEATAEPDGSALAVATTFNDLITSISNYNLGSLDNDDPFSRIIEQQDAFITVEDNYALFTEALEPIKNQGQLGGSDAPDLQALRDFSAAVGPYVQVRAGLYSELEACGPLTLEREWGPCEIDVVTDAQNAVANTALDVAEAYENVQATIPPMESSP